MPYGAALKLDQLAGHAVVQAGGTGNTVADHCDSAGLALLDRILVVFDLGADDAGRFVRVLVALLGSPHNL